MLNWLKKQIVKILVATGIVGIAFAAVLSEDPVISPPQDLTVLEMIEGKTKAERISIKSTEIVNHVQAGTFDNTRYGVQVEIQSVNKIEGGIEVMARAFKDGKQLGFGRDGSVDIERFRIYNPPILVSDGTKKEVLVDGHIEFHDNFKEDLTEAVVEVLAHTAKVSAKPGTIVPSRIGRTTTTVYPDPHAESTSVDGDASDTGNDLTWTNIIAEAGSGATDSSNSAGCVTIASSATTGQWEALRRGVFLFDTSSISDTDTLDDATLSLYGSGGGETFGTEIDPDINIYSSAPASNTAVVAGDFNSLGSTAFSTAVTHASWNISGYNDYSLNASGESAVDFTGISKFGSRNANYDVADSAPNWESQKTAWINCYYADQAGTTNDPKLVINHTAAAADHLYGGSSGGATTGGFFMY